MRIDVFITTEVFDRDGKLRFKHKRRSRSFVKAFLAILFAQTYLGAGATGIADYLGEGCDILVNEINFRCELDPAVFINGVLVGTGTKEVEADDYDLESRIVDGTGEGQLSWSDQLSTPISVSDPNVSFSLYRDFTNSSGAPITVNEEGIVAYAHADKSGVVATYGFLIIRDVEATGVAVADGMCLRVTYTLKTST